VRFQEFVGMFYFVFDLGRNIDLDDIADKVASGSSDLGWTLRKDKPSERFYNPNYLEIIPHFLEIELKPISMKMLDIESWTDVARRREPMLGSRIYSKLIGETKLFSPGSIDVAQMVRIYPNGIAVARTEVDFVGEFDTDHVVGIMNGLMDFDGKMVTATGQVLSLKELFGFVKEELTKLSNARNFLKSPDTYTVILIQEMLDQPKKLDPDDLEIYALSIRRIEDWRRISLDIAKEVQRNVGFYNDEIAIISSRNTLLYLPKVTRDVIEDLYLRGIECLRAMSVLFQYYDLLLTSVVEAFPEISTKIAPEKLEESVIELESLRMEIMRSMDAFRRFTTAISFRVKYVFQTVFKAFGLSEILETLGEKLENVDAILAAAYQVRNSIRERERRRLLEALNILIGVVFSGFIYQTFGPYAFIFAIGILIALLIYFIRREKTLTARLKSHISALKPHR
jgi:hypothetical protein